MLGAVALLGGLPASLVAFAMAVVARVKHEQWALLWLPLSLFPGLLVIVVLAGDAMARVAARPQRCFVT